MFDNINQIYVVGDLHGEMEIGKLNTKNFPEQKTMTGTNLIIQVGDFGLVWKNEEQHKRLHSIYEAPQIIPEKRADKTEKYWLDWLDRKPFYTLFIAGNHENYDRLEKYPLIDFHGGKAAQISKKVFYLKNGYVYDFGGLKFWMFGGATSIDISHRREGVSWWRQEASSYKEMQFGLDNLRQHNYKVDYVITHTLPKIIMEIEIYKSYFGEKNLYPCPVSSYLSNVFEAIKDNYIAWFAGHFHFDEELVKNIYVLYNKIRCINANNKNDISVQ